MKLLVFAQTPPPLHGQSAMVQAMLDGLRGRPGLTLHHVNLRLSRDNADIGRWRSGKILVTLALSLRAIATGLLHGCETLYYVPSPAKRGALYRDWTVMLLCRPFFGRLVLHWHAAGLAEWLETKSAFERAVTRWLLGRAHLSIVLANALRRDAEYLRARRIAVVPNGVPYPGPSGQHRQSPGPWQSLFLGLCTEEKGLFAAADAVVAANRRLKAPPEEPIFTLVAAGPFPDAGTAQRFERFVARYPGILWHAGVVDEASKNTLFAASRCLILPTTYAAEALPLVVLEALAHDIPILATNWRALPEIVTPECGRLVPPHDERALTEALIALREAPPAPGVCRDHYLKNFRLAQHLEQLSTALLSIGPRR